MVMPRGVVLLAHTVATATGVTVYQHAKETATANPVRKIVYMLQSMQKKVGEEAEHTEDLHTKFMCFCKGNSANLAASISSDQAKLPQLTASIEASVSGKEQLDADLKSHLKDRNAAKKSKVVATALRKKEKSAFDSELKDSQGNLAALTKAIAAISNGRAGAFLQSSSATVLKGLVTETQDMLSADRQELVAFLSGDQSEGELAPGTDEIVGILKQMKETMLANQKQMVAEEKAAVDSYQGLMDAKSKQVKALSRPIESKTKRIGDLGIDIARLHNDRDDTAGTLEQDQEFIANLKENCDNKEKTHEQDKKMRAQELLALADTIQILNDDDTLELFKKTLPSASSSFLQMQSTSESLRTRAQAVLSLAQKSEKSSGSRHHLDFILLALRGKKVGFERVAKLIDELVATLKEEQVDDDNKKEFCGVQSDQVHDKIHGLAASVSDFEAAIAENKDVVANLAEDIAALKRGIAALDKEVAEASAQRKAEKSEFDSLIASNSAAKRLILLAKNRLHKFYDASLYRAEKPRELSTEDQIYTNNGGEITTQAPGGIANTGVTAFVQVRSSVSVPPEAAAAYAKKESGGVLTMMDLLVKDLDGEIQEATTEEKNANEAFSKFTVNAASKRTQDSKALVGKESAKADSESALEESAEGRRTKAREFLAAKKYEAQLHAECDWLIQYHDTRKEARASEVDSLVKAKAVLSGADYSL